MHKFECNSNGLWQGSWPMCLPKKTCAKEDITTSLPSSIVIEQIGNVYYTNDTDWAAIDHTWVRYACANLDGIMVGKNDRMCSGGKWSNKIPTCTQGKGKCMLTGGLHFFIIMSSLLQPLPFNSLPPPS